jgi:hypothetical protein
MVQSSDKQRKGKRHTRIHRRDQIHVNRLMMLSACRKWGCCAAAAHQRQIKLHVKDRRATVIHHRKTHAGTELIQICEYQSRDLQLISKSLSALAFGFF